MLDMTMDSEPGNSGARLLSRRILVGLWLPSTDAETNALIVKHVTFVLAITGTRPLLPHLPLLGIHTDYVCIFKSPFIFDSFLPLVYFHLLEKSFRKIKGRGIIPTLNKTKT